MTVYRLESTRFEIWWVLDCCDDGLQAGEYKVEIWCVLDWCDDWLQSEQYKVSNLVCLRLV
jgi:hypothetical protein